MLFVEIGIVEINYSVFISCVGVICEVFKYILLLLLYLIIFTKLNSSSNIRSIQFGSFQSVVK